MMRPKLGGGGRGGGGGKEGGEGEGEGKGGGGGGGEGEGEEEEEEEEVEEEEEKDKEEEKEEEEEAKAKEVKYLHSGLIVSTASSFRHSTRLNPERHDSLMCHFHHPMERHHLHCSFLIPRLLSVQSRGVTCVFPMP
ncbi:hypothetical protein Pmani_004417 [Petrolisthes manimaculis]|uniref:Uncharacterized protein n=1 Tax=Petrolisthes manimaculis TaxID=1843537 RepID=A0AAE1QEA3_9EUCA|nr:hypothetical protein Pmani_004417 [Petrolisthes manimaculis]